MSEVITMDYKQIDKQIRDGLDVYFELDLTELEKMIFRKKYIELKPTYRIASEVHYGATKVKKKANDIRRKFVKYISAKEL